MTTDRFFVRRAPKRAQDLYSKASGMGQRICKAFLCTRSCRSQVACGRDWNDFELRWHVGVIGMTSNCKFPISYTAKGGRLKMIADVVAMHELRRGFRKPGVPQGLPL